MSARADTVFNFRIDAEDRALLDALAAAEKLSRADVLKRAMREHAKRLGVEAPPPKKARTR